MSKMNYNIPISLGDVILEVACNSGLESSVPIRVVSICFVCNIVTEDSNYFEYGVLWDNKYNECWKDELDRLDDYVIVKRVDYL